MSGTGTFSLRRLAPSEMGLLIDWMDREGWNPGLADAQAFAAADPEGFFVGELNGKPVACGAAVRYGDDFAFCGCYIVEPAHRHQGFGWALTLARLEHVGGRITGIDGVLAMQAQYAKIGYRIAWRNVRYGGIAPVTATSLGLASLRQMDLAPVFAYDAGIFPAQRQDFLQSWFLTPGHVGLAAVESSRITGYVVRRPCRQGWKIGPLFADHSTTAERLLDAILSGITGETFVIDVPEINAPATAMVQARQLRPVFETARMYRNGLPTEDPSRVFGVTTFELG